MKISKPLFVYLLVVGLALTSTAFAIYTFGQYQTGTTTVTTSGQYPLQVDNNQFLRAVINNSTSSPVNVSITNPLSSSNTSSTPVYVQPIYNYSYINSISTTTVKGSAGILHSITIDTPATGTIISVYDGTTTGTLVAQITLPAVLLNQGPMTAIYDVQFNTALTIMQTVGTSTFTVSYQ